MNCSLWDRKLNIVSIVSILILAMTLSLAGCGGGGGGSGSDSGTSTKVFPTSNNAAFGAARLAWQSPTRNVDNSCADDIDGYRVSYGSNPGGYYTHDEVTYLSHGTVFCDQTGYDAQCGLSVLSCTYTVSNLQPGTWYFSVQTVDNQGNYSDYSEEVSATIFY